MRVGISKTLNILLFLFLMVGGIEITLRILWANPYVLLFPDAYIHHPNLHRIFRHLDRVYEGAPDHVYFNTSSLGFIENRRTRELDRGDGTNFYGAAFGGSTTESATVQENSRWTDLLSFPVLNYGLSRMTSVNNYLAMKHVLQVQG
ncbi:MAG: hypothetical protein HYW02_06200, partial [Deltaproteobacteria bacterium]|nr:hypothetical protein [Deltaproteobacteria bacterium]